MLVYCGASMLGAKVDSPLWTAGCFSLCGLDQEWGDYHCSVNKGGLSWVDKLLPPSFSLLITPLRSNGRPGSLFFTVGSSCWEHLQSKLLLFVSNSFNAHSGRSLMSRCGCEIHWQELLPFLELLCCKMVLIAYLSYCSHTTKMSFW